MKFTNGRGICLQHYTPSFSLRVGQGFFDSLSPDISSECSLRIGSYVYHIAIITLCDLQTGRERTPFRTDSISDVDSVYHAPRSLCGIVINNENMTMGLITLWSFLACSKYIQTFLLNGKPCMAHRESSHDGLVK